MVCKEGELKAPTSSVRGACAGPGVVRITLDNSGSAFRGKTAYLHAAVREE